MTVELTESTAVLTLWWIALGLTVVVIVPLAIYLLHRTWRAAKMIERYTAETLEAATGVADHTRMIPALDETVDALEPIVQKASVLAKGASRLATVLRRRAGLEREEGPA